MTPGVYIRMRREAGGKSLDDVAIALETIPHVSARTRAEWLGDVEAGVAPVSIDVGLALSDVLDLDWDVLVSLCAIAAGIGADEPRLCRICGCSEFDPCEAEHGETCAWVPGDPTLCTSCVGREAHA